MRIVVNNLSYTYSPKAKDLAVRAINNISLTVEEGDFFGIIGRTGSGKSTFVQHLNGLIKTQKNNGEIKIGDFDLTDKKCDFKTLRAKVGMVFQYPEHQLFAENVFEDVAFGYKNYKSDATKEQVELAVKGALEEVGLDYLEIKDKSPFDLSGGQKRRVAIAGVIVTRPEVLVLDEPAAGLDPVGKSEFIALLHKLHQSFVKTIILVSHDMNLVSENCTSVAVFSGGKITAVGTPKEIYSDYQNIEQLGLDLPVTAYLQKELCSAGISIDCDLTVSDFIDKICERVKGGKR
jgi:energy-coupling factor transport system ATP-binding protein